MVEDKTPTTLEQKWAQRAFCAVDKVSHKSDSGDFKKSEYLSFAKSFPNLIHSCGLIQALAFAQSKNKTVFLADLSFVMNGEKKYELIIEESRKATITKYLQLSRHTLAAAEWIKRYAEALLKEDGDHNDSCS
ncbi:type III-B CRISPR module-associated protein Cmr5 [Aminobacterium sp. MB27-C1]|uniref:type III-B CRISPR module-associated protein Cmr5 n=1 Tax=Aminobacterium sp. MB27-C1 TaxID=3070661 RepID=UPI001BCF806A|nr:type III-B CRISPR module-associated protein Cmr5 [Aminobacterium sp. MB27-C1]WMI71203.1 type III-B CRISPR module-associated protein Cmr5 [Aminobacterium sp. MB27-C1]